MKSAKYLMHLLYAISILILFSCSNDNDSELQNHQEFTSQIKPGNLLIEIKNYAGNYQLLFEQDTLVIPSQNITSIQIDKSLWKTTLNFNDNSKIEIPSLGDFSSLKNEIKLNPTGYAPLSAKLNLSAPVEGKVKVRVIGKNGPATDVEYLFPKYGYNHEVVIHGLYPDYNNQVEISYTDNQGKKRVSQRIEIQTKSLSNMNVPNIKIVKLNPNNVESNYSLVNYLGESQVDAATPLFMDNSGDIRWILDLRTHPLLAHLNAGAGISRLKNGNFVCGDIFSGYIYEIDMLGTVLNSWSLRDKGYEFHHELIEKPNGNFIVCVDKKDTYHLTGVATIEDVIVEVDRTTGNIVREWDLKQSMDEYRNVLQSPFNRGYSDWAHNNSLIYDEKDDAIIISARFQGLIKLTADNRVKESSINNYIRFPEMI